MSLQQSREVGRVPSDHPVGLGGRFRNLVEIDEIHAAHGFADPICRPAGRDGEPDVKQGLGDFGGNVMSSILVPDDCNGCNLAIGRRSVLIIRFIEERVHALQDTLGHARWLTKPDWGTDQQYVAIINLPPEGRPVVPFPLVRGDAWLDVERGDANDFVLTAVGELIESQFQDALGRRCTFGFQGTIESKDCERHLQIHSR